MDQNKKLLLKYYLLGLPFLAILIFSSYLFEIQSFYTSMMLLGFIWSYTMNAPGLREKQAQRKSKFSFLALLYNAQFFMEDATRRFNRELLGRHITFLIFCTCLMLIGRSYNLLYPLIGIITYELFLRTFCKTTGRSYSS